MANKNRKSVSQDPGVKHDALIWCDLYTGGKDALIKAGIAKVEWFPAIGVRDKRGRIKRTFKIKRGDDTVTLCHGSAKNQNMENDADHWEIAFPISFAEQQKRHAARLAEGEAERKQRRETQAAEARAALGPFAAYAEGDRAILYFPGADDHLMQASVIKGYGPHKVSRYADDEEGELQYGYIVMMRGKLEPTFVPAHQLRDYADKPSHLKLAVDNRG